MPPYFDGDLERVGADKLKQMVRLWGGTAKMRKDECIDCIRKGLADPARVQRAVASLEPWERNALALIKHMGGVIDYRTLKVGIIAAGIFPPQSLKWNRTEIFTRLLRKGLVLVTGSYGVDYLLDSYSGEGLLYSDERLLSQVGTVEIRPLEISAMPTPAEPQARHPAAVVLDIMGILQVIEKMGGLHLTRSGDIRVSDVKNVSKAMHWDAEGIKIDGLFFPDALIAWVSAFRYSDLLELRDGDHLAAKESPESFAERPYSVQARLLMEGFIRSVGWFETPARTRYMSHHVGGLREGRLALTLAITALPLKSNVFFSFDDFEQALFDRVGEVFALDYPPQTPYSLYSDPAEKRAKVLADWRATLRADWRKQERPWLAGAFKTWLYLLGLVELSVSNETVLGFRLTDIGREVFHPELAGSAPKAETSPELSSQPAWVVQPNFDVIVYLDIASAAQMVFLERHAERKQTYQHTAHYRLTRASVYAGLENGTTLDELLNGLEAGFRHDLPQNVAVELREWAALRERIHLHRSARLVEFQDENELQEALDQGLAGRRVADRFVLLAKDAIASPYPAGANLERIDYTQPLPKNLSINEVGKAQLKQGGSDLIVRCQLDRWGERLSDWEWQVSAESVAMSLKNGQKINEFIEFLKVRSSSFVPPLLEVALRSWAGDTHAVELEDVVVLRCPQEHLFKAILGSRRLRPFLQGYLPPNLLFVDKRQLEGFRTQLDWLGLTVSDRLRIHPIEG